VIRRPWLLCLCVWVRVRAGAIGGWDVALDVMVVRWDAVDGGVDVPLAGAWSLTMTRPWRMRLPKFSGLGCAAGPSSTFFHSTSVAALLQPQLVIDVTRWRQCLW
jgi:hypothetical protein